jgi:putative NADH-flavin reductase
MNLTIFGASGQTGMFVVERALLQEDHVTAYVRSPETFPLSADSLVIVPGDVRMPGPVAQAIEGADAVICAVGARPGTGKSNVSSEATANIIAGMQQHGVRRLIAVTAAGLSGRGPRTSAISNLFMKVFVSLEDKERQEQLIRDSDLDWTIVRPPMLANEPHTGSYKVGEDLQPGIGSKFARADLADFIVDLLTAEETYLHQAPTVCY